MELRVHLKVCEGCGCLWYRAQVEIRVYCTACHQRFMEFPTPESRKRRGRPKKTTLPTVFAVRASAEIQEEEQFSEVGMSGRPQGGQWPGELFGASNCGSEFTFAAMIPQRGTEAAAFAGGAL
jgi:hypothetical protein